MGNCHHEKEQKETNKPTPIKIVIQELDIACAKISSFSDAKSFAAQSTATRLGSMAALKERHCVQMVCEPTVFYTGTAESLLKNMETFVTHVDRGIFASVDPTSSDGNLDYFLNYISNSCHVPEPICEHGCLGY